MTDAPVSEKARAAARAWMEQALADGLIPRGHKSDKPTVRAFARFEAEVRQECLCSHFDDPDQEQDDNVWGEAATQGYDETLDAILARYVTAIRAILDGEAG